MVPSGTMILSGLIKPSKFGISSSARHFTIRWQADFTKGTGQLIAASTCGADPVQSSVMLPPSIVMVTLSGIGSGASPSPSI